MWGCPGQPRSHPGCFLGCTALHLQLLPYGTASWTPGAQLSPRLFWVKLGQIQSLEERQGVGGAGNAGVQPDAGRDRLRCRGVPGWVSPSQRPRSPCIVVDGGSQGVPGAPRQDAQRLLHRLLPVRPLHQPVHHLQGRREGARRTRGRARTPLPPQRLRPRAGWRLCLPCWL